MDKIEFERRVLEQQIFNELKDAPTTGINYIRQKYQGLDIDYSRLYRKIINYQVKRYGGSLTTSREDVGIIKSKDEVNKINKERNRRKMYWKLKGEK